MRCLAFQVYGLMVNLLDPLYKEEKHEKKDVSNLKSNAQHSAPSSQSWCSYLMMIASWSIFESRFHTFLPFHRSFVQNFEFPISIFSSTNSTSTFHFEEILFFSFSRQFSSAQVSQASIHADHVIAHQTSTSSLSVSAKLFNRAHSTNNKDNAI